MAPSRPVKKMKIKFGGNERIDYAMAAVQGYEAKMEDSYAITLNLDAATRTSFFGVYDGHGGPAVSKYCARHLHIELRRHESFGDNPKTAIEKTFLRMDDMMTNISAEKELSGYGGNEYWRKHKKKSLLSRFLPCCQEKPTYGGPQHDGCTACVVLIRGNQIIVGNAGDSRCVLSRNDQVIDLSTEFKASLPHEQERIENSGHEVALNANVHLIDGKIAVSRSIGDLSYKNKPNLDAQNQAIIAFPEVRTENITQHDKFLIIASAGFWKCMSSEEAVCLVNVYLQNNAKLRYICGALLTKCLGDAKGKDNMTVVLVRFKTPGTNPVVLGKVAQASIDPTKLSKSS